MSKGVKKRVVPATVRQRSGTGKREAMGLPWDHAKERPTFQCPANHPLSAWVQRPACNGGGWVCGKCHPVYMNEKNGVSNELERTSNVA